LLHKQPSDFQIYFAPHSSNLQKQRLIRSAIKAQLLIGRMLTLRGYLSTKWQVARISGPNTTRMSKE
jgi:hypothetical protein